MRKVFGKNLVVPHGVAAESVVFATVGKIPVGIGRMSVA